MSVEISGIKIPEPVVHEQNTHVKKIEKIDKVEILEDEIEIPHGPTRITPERVSVLLSEPEEVHPFPEPAVFDQNDDGKLDVLDLVVNNPLVQGLKKLNQEKPRF